MGNLPLRNINTSSARTSRLVSSAHPELGIVLGNPIPETTILSGLLIAVADNNVALVKTALRVSGVDPNTQSDHYDNNTILHGAIMNDSPNVFNYLINRDDVNKDALNSTRNTPLSIASMNDKFSYVQKLVKKGANVNIPDQQGCTPLHYATRFAALKLCQLLIKSGSDLNERNLKGETPLHLACQYGSAEIIYMLLFSGADVTIPCKSGFIPLMIERVHTLEMELRLTLYAFTFDESPIPMELKTVVRAMVVKWPLFPMMLSKISEIIYDKSDLEDFNGALVDIKPDFFQLFFEKFEYIVKDMLLHCCTLTNYLTGVESMKRVTREVVDFLFIFLKSDILEDFIQSRCLSLSPISSLIKIFHKKNLPLSTLTEVVCCMLSYGLNVTPSDLNAAYVVYGHCELFQIMLHMDIEAPDETIHCCNFYDHEVIQKSIMPYFIYDANLNMEKFLQNPQSYLLMDLDVLLDYFAHPKLRDFFEDNGAAPQTKKKLGKLPSVPLLLELARDVARDHIIKRFGIEKSSRFYTVMKWLPVSDVYKRILSFQTKLY